jgi:cysteine desulfurase
MGLSRNEAQSSLRVSFGGENSLEEVEQFVEILRDVVTHLRYLQSKAALSSQV